jgi:hypothetical protein
MRNNAAKLPDNVFDFFGDDSIDAKQFSQSLRKLDQELNGLDQNIQSSRSVLVNKPGAVNMSNKDDGAFDFDEDYDQEPQHLGGKVHQIRTNRSSTEIDDESMDDAKIISNKANNRPRVEPQAPAKKNSPFNVHNIIGASVIAAIVVGAAAYKYVEHTKSSSQEVSAGQSVQDQARAVSNIVASTPQITSQTPTAAVHTTNETPVAHAPVTQEAQNQDSSEDQYNAAFAAGVSNLGKPSETTNDSVSQNLLRRIDNAELLSRSASDSTVLITKRLDVLEKESADSKKQVEAVQRSIVQEAQFNREVKSTLNSMQTELVNLKSLAKKLGAPDPDQISTSTTEKVSARPAQQERQLIVSQPTQPVQPKATVIRNLKVITLSSEAALVQTRDTHEQYVIKFSQHYDKIGTVIGADMNKKTIFGKFDDGKDWVIVND